MNRDLHQDPEAAVSNDDDKTVNGILILLSWF